MVLSKHRVLVALTVLMVLTVLRILMVVEDVAVELTAMEVLVIEKHRLR